MRKILFFFFLLINIVSFGQNLSNKGREFWVGYGHNQLFNAGGGGGIQTMVLYLSAEQPATVTVSVLGFTQTLNIPANTVVQTAPIPKFGVDDARLLAEGQSSKGIHIVSDVPIVAYAHQYGSNSSGAMMLLPVETYGYTYYSLNYKQETNAQPAYSWFFVIASEDNTTVEITPSAPTEGGRPANVPFTVTLNKGEIYNVFGETNGTTANCAGGGTKYLGQDLSGSKIKSVAGADTTCHPIAVFCGSSRMSINGESADIMQQQMFPSSAWGTSYLVYPTVNTQNVNQTNINYYRVVVKDPATKVRRNGVLMTGLTNGFYYEFSSTLGEWITADQPILVAQYVPSMLSCGTYNGDGDPEMFFLSPLQQAVNSTAFYSTSNQNISNNFVEIIIKAAGVPSLLIDGSNTFDLNVIHNRNAGYRVIVKSLAPDVQHTIVSDSTFNAITYGFGYVESYGFNAGTLMNNLDILPSLVNTDALTTGAKTFTCPDAPFKIRLQMLYKPSKILWEFSKVSKITPGTDTTIINPLPIDSAFANGRTYYTYELPSTYKLSDTGLYSIPMKITAPEIDNCNNTLDYLYNIKVNVGPKPLISFNYSTCSGDTAFVFAAGLANYNLYKYHWQFDDGTTDSVRLAKKVFNTIGTHPVKLTVVTWEGCVGDTTMPAITNPKPVADFSITPPAACPGTNIYFQDSSFFGGGLKSWYWDFGNGIIKTANNTSPQVINFPNAGTFTVKHFAQSGGSCKSDTVTKILKIFAKPTINFGSTAMCLSDSIVTFSDSTTIADGQALNYQWNFGDANATAANPNTSTLKNPTHKYTAGGTYKVTLTITTVNGCSNTFFKNITLYPSPAVDYTINSPAQCITGNKFVFTNNSSISVGSIAGYKWSFGDGGTATSINSTRTYATPGTYNVRLVVKSNRGCTDSITKQVFVYPFPVASFTINNPTQCSAGNSFTFTNTSTGGAGTKSYYWTFGDGGNASTQNATHSYASSGNFTVKLVVTTDGGCKDSTTKTVTVNSQPVASFAVNFPAQCVNNNTFVFSNTTTPAGPYTYNWKFGDGGTSTTAFPTHTYIAAGIFTVTLIATNPAGCIDTTTNTVTVNPKPVAGFSVNNPDQCLTGNSFVFTNTSTSSSGTMTYNWSFGDFTTSTLQDPVHTYSAAGTYNVRLITTSVAGCKDTIFHTITVNAKPVAGFTINAANQCVNGNSYVFNNTSTIVSGTMTYSWTFGDGGSSVAQNPTYVYATPGTYTVKLIVTSNIGCKDSISKTVIIYPKPVVSFTANNFAQCVNGNSFSFTNASSIPAGSLTYNWTFGDGGFAAVQNATHTYTSAGSYIVKLVPTSNNGCKDSTTVAVTVFPKPIVGFTVNSASQCKVGNTFAFTDTSKIASGTLSYNWSFGDGGASTVKNPAHSYAATGSYTVKVVVTSSNGCKDSALQTVTVTPMPVAAFSINNISQCINGNSYVFNNTSTVATGSLTYSWSFGDGGTSTVKNPVYVYSAAGTYTVKLVVISGNGCKDSTTQTVTVTPRPTAAFTINNASQCLTGNTYTFTGTSTPAANITAYSWTFGDGGNSAVQNPTYNYTAAGTYTVKLIITAANGCTDTTTRTVTVDPQPNVSFTIPAASQCVTGNSFSFNNTSTIATGSMTYKWTFSDGGSSLVVSPTYSYAAPGTYTVRLFATSSNGCTDSTVKTVTVNPKPAVAFAVNTVTQCLNTNSYSFTNASSISIGTITYKWKFGDGGASTLQNPTYNYTAAGSYTVTLVVTSSNGCIDSTLKVVTVTPQPTAAFTINAASQCVTGNTFAFTNTSTSTTGVLTYKWSFGDAGTSTVQNPSHTYAAAGTYAVTLVATSSNGCTDTATQTVIVNPKPVASFTVNTANQCLKGNSFAFTNGSTISTGTITYAWTFDDGGTSALQNPSHVYSAAGNYQVKLVVSSNNGCKDSTTKSVIVYPSPVAGFTINTPNQCLNGNRYVFTGTAPVMAGMSYSWDFGDGGAAVSRNPSYTYTTAGTYVVKLVVSTTNGCKDSISQNVTVYPKPQVSFTINSVSQCVNGNSYAFTNTTSGLTGTSAYSWTFGDGGTSSTQNPTHIYTTAGSYSVKLVVTSNNGCKDSLSQMVVVYPKPIVSFNVNDTAQCPTNNSFAFTNTSSVGGSAYTATWYFGDGATSNVANTSHTYATAGTYTVKLVIESVNGCKDSITHTVIVHPLPGASFTVAPQGQCLTGNSFNFTNTSVNTPAGTYLWKFGDGGTSTANNATHTYASHGNYTVKLIVTSANGCVDSVSKVVTVYPQPTAAFSVNNSVQCQAGNVFRFINNSSISSGTLLFSWNFGDGNTSAGISPIHTYAAAGTYNVKLVVTTGNGCKDSIIQSVTVNPSPTASFTINNSDRCLKDNKFSFTNTSTVTGAASYNWTFGDGGTSNITSPSYSYSAEGTYTVRLTVTLANGCSDSTSKVVIVYPTPVAAFTVSKAVQCFTGNSFSFSNSSSVATGTLTYSWHFDDGGRSTLSSPSHSYAAAGSYNVKLIVTSNSGCVDSVIRTVSVMPQPAVSFTVNDSDQCVSGNAFVFTNNSVATGTPSYSWAFGDGGTSTLGSSAHAYATAGSYIVKLVVTSGSGCKDSTQKTVVVYPKPVAAFAINSIAQCVTGNTFTFTNGSSIATGAYSSMWYFDDGNTSTSASPVHSYTNSGTYVVKLVVTSGNGCKDSTTKTITVNPKPSPAFTVNNSSQCFTNNSFAFTNTTPAIGAVTYQWLFGDGGISNIQNPLHSYTAAGSYTVKLIVTTTNGCKDSTSRSVTVYAKPNVAFSINTPAQCLDNNQFTFTNNSSVAGSGYGSSWSFGDGGTSPQASPTYRYQSAGSYFVKLVITSTDGCKDSLIKTIVVQAKPVARFYANDSAQCLGRTFNFTNTGSSTGTTTYAWTFGDGGTASGQNATHLYTSPDTFNVRLIMTNGNGCKDTAVRQVIVHPRPLAAFIIGVRGQCINDNNFTFSNSSTIKSGGLSYLWSLGDGTTSVHTDENHIYGSVGTFNVTMIASSELGCKDTALKSVTIYPKPNPSFSINNANQCFSGNSYTFTNTTTGTTSNTQKWYFGSGDTSRLTAPVHSYLGAGNYTVRLVVTSPAGCVDSVQKPVAVYPQPVAEFTVNNAGQCTTNNNFVFANTSSVDTGTITHRWTFGDNTGTTQTSPSHAYAAAGSYDVRLITTSNFGCIDSTKQTMTVSPNPKAGFTVNDKTQCLDVNNFVFTNTSTAPAGSEYLWTFGDGTNSSSTSTYKSYTRDGNYTVRLTIKGTNGCNSDTVSTIVTVAPIPSVNAGPDQVVLENKIVMLQATASAIGATYLWDPAASLSSSNVLTPLASPKVDTRYKLTVNSAAGCKNSDEVFVKVLKTPTIPNAFSPNGDGINDTWTVKYLADFPGAVVEIFNRYGVSVYRSIGYSKPWDGTMNGSPLPVGTYYYIIEPKNGLDKFTGSVTIIR